MTPQVGDLVPWIRQMTGIVRYTAAVVEYHGQILKVCSHRHRSARTAWACAKQMTKRMKQTQGDAK